MQSLSRTLAPLALALGFGVGGYFIGKTSVVVPPPVSRMARAGGDNGIAAGNSRTGTESLDPVQLRAALNSEPNPLARFRLALQNLESWVAKNPKDALDWLAGQPPSARRDEVIRMALDQFSDIDAKGAADWATANLTGDELNNVLIAIAENWATESGREAATWFLDLPPTRERDGAVEHIFFSWASNEPAAALEFLAANASAGDLTPTLRRAALAGWAKSDPEGAVAASLTSSRANNDPDQFANTLANWATMDLEGSSKWLLANLPAGRERTVAAQELAVIFARQSPESGVAWLEKLDAGAERDAAASALLANWSASGPTEAAQWAASRKSGDFAPQAVTELAHQFALRDAAGFQTWLAALPPGPLKESAQAGAPTLPEEDD